MALKQKRLCAVDQSSYEYCVSIWVTFQTHKEFALVCIDYFLVQKFPGCSVLVLFDFWSGASLRKLSISRSRSHVTSLRANCQIERILSRQLHENEDVSRFLWPCVYDKFTWVKMKYISKVFRRDRGYSSSVSFCAFLISFWCCVPDGVLWISLSRRSLNGSQESWLTTPNHCPRWLKTELMGFLRHAFHADGINLMIYIQQR